MFKIAAAQYQIEKLTSWQAYQKKAEGLVSKAKHQQAKLLLLPEYAGMEIVCEQFDNDQQLFASVQELIPQYLELYQQLAREYQMYIQAGTIIQRLDDVYYTPRAYFFSPNGDIGYQDKMHLTEYEKNSKLLKPAIAQRIFQTTFGNLGIAVCYDCEFPETIRRFIKAEALLILVPSYTTSLAGFYRTFISARARAIENQCYVAVSYAVNNVGVNEENEIGYGQAAVFSPADRGFPDDGIIAHGEMNDVNLVVAPIYFDKIKAVRLKGQVQNYQDIAQNVEIESKAVEYLIFN